MSTAPEVTLGVLRSEFDQNRSVAQPFVDVADVVGELVGAYSRSLLEQDVTYRALALLRLVDESGSEWTLGATTRRWYRRRPAAVWRVAAPPAVADAALVASCEAAMKAVEELLEVDTSSVPSPAVSAVADSGVDSSDGVATDEVQDDLLVAFLSSGGSETDDEPTGAFGV